MKKILEGAKNIIAPAPETLWERGGATMRTVEIDPGRYEEVPFFDLEISHRGKEHEEPMLDELERCIGRRITQTIVTSDGIDRATRIFLPHERNNDFIVQLTTPWLTSIDGHNSEGVAETISRELGVAVVLIGAEHSARKHRFPLDIMRIGRTIVQTHGISLAKTAQSCQLITADICERFNLPTNIVKTGESRGGMEADGEYIYADLYGNNIVYQDTTAKCLPDRVFSEGSESDKLLQFPGSELVGVGFITAKVIKERAAKKYVGTLSTNPNFWWSSIVGIGPALASGEAGGFIKWLPRRSAVHHVSFDHDVASRPHRYRELYKNHPNVANITLTGSHATLAHTDTLRHLIDRIRSFATQFELSNFNLDEVEWKLVHLKDDDRYRTMVSTS